jgi:antitoxin (DNA-binding transcriptional repressor) of toxin-antitoxin stability system
MIINISDAKTQVSKLVDMVHHGEKVGIAKNNTPLVDLVRHIPEGKRTLGILSGQISIPDDFYNEDQEVKSLFYSDGN